MPVRKNIHLLIDTQLALLGGGDQNSVPPESRAAICAALGPSLISDKVRDETRRSGTLPKLSVGDRIRARLAILAARKVEGLWPQACLETEMNHGEKQDSSEVRHEMESYLAQRDEKFIEHISAFDVPRAFVPSHILEMAEIVLAGRVHDCVAFRHEANEWWGIYGRPEFVEREFSIKWAAQDALYEAIGWVGTRPEAQHALNAFAGIFQGAEVDDRRCILDESKQIEFWRWWLSEAIPQAIASEKRT